MIAVEAKVKALPLALESAAQSYQQHYARIMTHLSRSDIFSFSPLVLAGMEAAGD